MTQIAQRANVSAVYLAGVRYRRDGALDTRLAQQMQHGKGRTIGIVFDVLGLGLRELILGMKARALRLAFQTQFVDGRVADVQEFVVLDEVRQYPRMDQQSRLAAQCIRRMQLVQLRAKIVQQRRRGPLLADAKAHAIAAVHALRKGTQIEADDAPFQPAAGCRDDFVGCDGKSSGTARSLISPTSSMLIAR